MRKMIGIALAASAFLVSACNTVDGMGRDLQSASSETEEAIN